MFCRRQRREVSADDCRCPAREGGLDGFAPDHVVVQWVSGPMRGQVEMQMGYPIPKHVDVDDLSARRLLDGSGRSSENRPKGPGLLSVDVRDMGNMSLRLEKREPGDFTTPRCGKPPQIVLPYLNPFEFVVCLDPPA